MKRYPARCPDELPAALEWSLWAPRVTFRRYGAHGEHERPMVHRFRVRGGTAVANVMAANILLRPTPLLDRLMGKR